MWHADVTFASEISIRDLVSISSHNNIITVGAEELTMMGSCSVWGYFQTILPSIIPVIYSASAVDRNMTMHQSLCGILSRHFIFFPRLLFLTSLQEKLSNCFAAIYHLFYHKIILVSYRKKCNTFHISSIRIHMNSFFILYMYCEHCGIKISSWLHWF